MSLEHLAQTISIPFIIGDEDGLLTNELIYAVAALPALRVRSSAGDYSLEVSIVSLNDERIGFRFDPQKIRGEINVNILADEARRSMCVEVVLCKNGKTVWGPCMVQQDQEYDYVDGDSFKDLTFVNSQGELKTSLAFSLGQLEPIEAAQEGVKHPLYQKLARKIANAISLAIATNHERVTSSP